MFVTARKLAYWIFVLWTRTLNLKIRLTWNQILNPLRYATMLHAIPIILGMNPQDHEKCDIALTRLPSGTKRYIHDLCVKALVSGASDEYCERLFYHYILTASEAGNICSNFENRIRKTRCNLDRITFYKQIALSSKYVNEKLQKVPIAMAERCPENRGVRYRYTDAWF